MNLTISSELLVGVCLQRGGAESDAIRGSGATESDEREPEQDHVPGERPLHLHPRPHKVVLLFLQNTLALNLQSGKYFELGSGQ